jgi:hypothetical protein
MRSMLATKLTKLLKFQFVCSLLFVLSS